MSKVKVVGVFRGLIISIALLLISNLILGIVTSYTSIAISLTSRWITIFHYIAIFIGGAIAAYSAENNGWLNGGLVGLIYMVAIVLLGLLWYPFNLSLLLALKILIAFIVSALGGIIGINII
ncbi:putative membrane protein, TIGR04086 family/integral membrane protein, TIGR04097 family [Halobacteroides halobius DSM 5150]|uniref:Putative membrane protein, TIGR04086 family/integral membrane protein, TIGR04097 family n=1 Tax=Halobacteroides halobius (strain ATCC 35273 / DSM 5150 / MD-1) TaxID=748449 RepID=L0K846_HALHC|nr:TIGR04086 family membrane protein [Halobacteroides halobius]AGB40720.1 putative membrane protein, TIGR04086 family/integral membrane protein, TIGR04097 family [Halobacteroides halobius DSM 5150]